MHYGAPKPLILLAEEVVLVALDLQEQLQAAGFEVAGPFGAATDALAWLRDNTPDCAVSGVRLQDGFTQSLADELFRRGVPHIVLSTMRREQAPPEFAGAAAWLDKPARSGEVVAAVQALAIVRRAP